MEKKKFGRKLLVGVLASAISLVGGTSAFAYDGFADSVRTAHPLNGPVGGISSLIQGSDDVDWYSWTNTGPTVYITATLQSPTGKNYDLHVAMMTNGINPTSIGAATDHGVGGADTFATAVIHSGTIYYQVRGQKGSDYDYNVPYTLNITN
ncbi:hypothetical protein GK047_23645 [Paenibacillus sp. SYP-B3998]|uniref:Uncharacterized protein n=1 Tax=Paenibacillus sp. SYP-B3998 TaxID=2678564 RepID=A0A6G4A592_9BACL|nr:hypothetical protein [Paenibacillus sp. SYP-B3998]NEW08991.1 hypothetical protein [Paenibacillus sp. SYP-B3998]